MPVLPNLTRLELSDNLLNGEDLNIINTSFRKLQTLIIANNSIKSFDNIAMLFKCTALKEIDLSANPVTEMNNYRENVFEKLTTLDALDGFDKDGSEWSLQGIDEAEFKEYEMEGDSFNGDEEESAEEEEEVGMEGVEQVVVEVDISEEEPVEEDV